VIRPGTGARGFALVAEETLVVISLILSGHAAEASKPEFGNVTVGLGESPDEQIVGNRHKKYAFCRKGLAEVKIS
jgi:hypothetical protein